MAGPTHRKNVKDLVPGDVTALGPIKHVSDPDEVHMVTLTLENGRQMRRHIDDDLGLLAKEESAAFIMGGDQLEPRAYPVRTDEGALFTPWTDGRAVGYKVTAEGKPDMYIYLNPSGGQDTGKVDDTDVFIYRGGDGDPSMDGTECYVNVWEGE